MSETITATIEPAPALLTSAQLMAALGINGRMLKKWNRGHLIPSIGATRARRYDLGKVMEAMRANNLSAETAAAAPKAPEAKFPELLTQVQMAQRLGVTRRTLHNWVQDKTVPMIKVRGFCRFEPEKVLAALQRHEINSAPKEEAQ